MSVFAEAIDRALEWSVGGSFTRVGSSVRRRLFGWQPLDQYDLAGRVIVISGATSGLGLEAARQFATMGATVEIIARNAEKAASVCAVMKQATGNNAVDHVVADMGDLEAVRRAARVILERHRAIDVLIHNAGALDDVRHESPQQIELTVASQVVGPFLLTGLLRDALRAAAPSRVLWVSSGGMYSEPLSVATLEMPADGYNGTTAYARAKRAQVTLGEMLATRLAADHIIVHSMHPGWADTPGVARSLPTFRTIVGRLLRTPAEGADTLIWLAADDGAPMQSSGGFWLDRRRRTTHRFASTRRSDTDEERARLWEWVVQRSGVEPELLS